MNTALLRPDVQAYLSKHQHTDLHTFILKGSPFEDVSIQELAQQLDGRRRMQHKLPLWYNTSGMLFPPKLNLEQTSSEVTASYKAALMMGDTLFDGTGGFGIDSYYFAQRIPHITYAEQNESLFAFAKANFERLNVDNISMVRADSIAHLKAQTTTYDLIYFDPGRRDASTKKVFRLEDCEPDMVLHRPFLLKKTKQLWIKTAPFLDITAAVKALQQVSELHIIAVDNEVKELLWCVKDVPPPSYNYEITVVNLKKAQLEKQVFTQKELHMATASYAAPKKFLYEPNAALLKAGAFEWISAHFALDKLHKHSHLYTSEKLVNFSGRRFRILEVLPYSKALKKRFAGKKHNVTTRNFPMKVADIRKKLNIKDGGTSFLFFTTLTDQSLVVIICTKV